MVYHPARTALIVAWGREADKLPKRFLQPKEESTILEYVLDAVWTVADSIYIIFRKEPSLKLIESISNFGVKIIVENQHSTIVSSLVTGLKAIKSEYCLVLRENTPFLKPSILHMLFDAVQGYEAALPRWADGKVEPLLAVYRRKSLLSVAPKIADQSAPTKILEQLYSIKYVDIEQEIKPIDPELESFFSIESDEDLAKARQMVSLKYKL